MPVTDEGLGSAPEAPAVFRIEAGAGSAYLARTRVLRRRLSRVMKLWNLREIATAVEYWPVNSRLEASLVHYSVARRLFPADYARRVKLGAPAYVKLILANRFPRTQVTTRLSAAALFHGPFRSRASAERFENGCLDLFQLRRCQEDLEPRPDHPGCPYGEMNLCLRPCQEVVGEEEYRGEAERVAAFLRDGGAALLQNARAARERLSAEMRFEDAARQHRRVEKIQAALALRDELAHELDGLNGVAVTPGGAPGTVRLWFLLSGWWQAPHPLTLSEAGESIDAQLRRLVESLEPWCGTTLERQEHLSLLAAWRYSSWAENEWLPFDSLDRLPYRRLVNAVARQAAPAV